MPLLAAGGGVTITGVGAFLFTLPNPVPAGLEPRDGLAEATESVDFRIWYASILKSVVAGVPIDLPISDVFREVLLLLIELILELDFGELGRAAAGCSAVGEVDGFLMVICLPIRERVLLYKLVTD